MKKALKLLFLFILISFMCFSVSANQENFDGYIVKFKENTSSVLFENASLYEALLFSELKDEECVELLSQEFDTVNPINSTHLLASVKDENDLELLLELGVVEEYEPDYMMELLGFKLEDNSFYSVKKWEFDCINADFSFNAGITGNGVRVAVIDSGVYPHQDIVDNILPGYNYCTSMSNYDPYDTTDNLYHGTFVAGIIAAACNDTGIVGLSHKAEIVPLKVTDCMNFSLSTAIQAIYDAVDVFDCDVINMSLGASNDSSALNNAVSYAVKNGALVVAAAGNSGNAGYFYPAAYTNVVSVANAKKVSNGDSYSYVISESSQVNNRVNIAAPGTNVYSIRNTLSGVTTGSGTSFACPYVSASAALLKSLFPDMQQPEFLTYLKMSANGEYLTSSQGKNYWGDGMLDVEQLIKTACLQRGMDFYESDVYTVDGSSFVYFTNLTNDYVDNCTVVLTGDDSEDLPSFKNVQFLKLLFGPYESKEYTVTDDNRDYNIYFNYLPGDVDGNGVVNNIDAAKILQYIVGWNDNCVMGALDVNNDSVLNCRDAARILQYVVGRDVELN